MPAIPRDAGPHFRIWTIRQAVWLTPGLTTVCSNLDGPEIRIVLTRRWFEERINEPPIEGPDNRAMKARTGEDEAGLAGGGIQNAERSFRFLPSVDIDSPNEGDVPAVGRPNDGLEVISGLAKNLARLLSVGLHLPDFLAAIFTAKEDYF